MPSHGHPHKLELCFEEHSRKSGSIWGSLMMQLTLHKDTFHDTPTLKSSHELFTVLNPTPPHYLYTNLQFFNILGFSMLHSWLCFRLKNNIFVLQETTSAIMKYCLRIFEQVSIRFEVSNTRVVCVNSLTISVLVTDDNILFSFPHMIVKQFVKTKNITALLNPSPSKVWKVFYMQTLLD